MDKGTREVTMARTYSLGEYLEQEVEITEQRVRAFAEATGDFNPLHLDEEYARGTIFGSRVAHGMIHGGIFSAIMGQRFPGPGTIYLSQTLRFRKPVFLGERIRYRVEIVEIIQEKNRLKFKTEGYNSRGETVVTGEAWVIAPP